MKWQSYLLECKSAGDTLVDALFFLQKKYGPISYREAARVWRAVR